MNPRRLVIPLVALVVVVLGAVIEVASAGAQPSCFVTFPCEMHRRTAVEDATVRARLGRPELDDADVTPRRESALQRSGLARGMGSLVHVRSTGPLVLESAEDASDTDPAPIYRQVTDVRRFLEREGYRFGSRGKLVLELVTDANVAPRLRDDTERLLSGTELYEQVFAGGVRCYECRAAVSYRINAPQTIVARFASNAATLVTEPRYTGGEAREALERQHVGRMRRSKTPPELRIFLGADGLARLAWVVYHYDFVCNAWRLSAAEVDPTTLEWIRDIDPVAEQTDRLVDIEDP